MNEPTNRRSFLKVAAMIACCPRWGNAAESDRRPLAGVVGMTTGSLNNQRRSGQLNVLTLPKFVRDELGMQMIDINTNWLKSFEKSYVERVRGVAEDAGCFFTNLKVNHEFGDLYDPDPNDRRTAMNKARQRPVSDLLSPCLVVFPDPSSGACGSGQSHESRTK